MAAKGQEMELEQQSKKQKQQAFIELRASGFSYDHIASTLHVAKSTLLDWNRELIESITEAEAIKQQELAREYQATKLARCRNLAEITNRAWAAAQKIDFDKMAQEQPALLLKVITEYNKALKDECLEREPLNTDGDQASGMATISHNLFNGSVDANQAKAQLDLFKSTHKQKDPFGLWG